MFFISTICIGALTRFNVRYSAFTNPKMSTHEREKDQQGHLDDQGNMDMEEKEPRTSDRLHEKTQKGHEQYI